MKDNPPPGPRLILSLRFEDVCDTEDEAREMRAQMKVDTAISYAKDFGDSSFVSALLRDPDQPLSQSFRDWLADFLDGAHKRLQGRPLDLEKLAQRWEAARLFVVLTVHLKLPEKEAVARLAEFYGVGLGTIREWLTKERARLGRRIWREMEEHANTEFESLLLHFPDEADLQRLLGNTNKS